MQLQNIMDGFYGQCIETMGSLRGMFTYWAVKIGFKEVFKSMISTEKEPWKIYVALLVVVGCSEPGLLLFYLKIHPKFLDLNKKNIVGFVNDTAKTS